jgi:uncharacterized protein (DUF302 family)
MTTGSAPHYVIARVIPADFATTVERVRAALARVGFGVLTEIDVRATLKKKLDAEFKEYVILGACHPPSALRVLSEEESLGVFLPCNVVVHAAEGGTAVKAVRPTITLASAGNPALEPLGREVEAMLSRAVESV